MLSTLAGQVHQLDAWISRLKEAKLDAWIAGLDKAKMNTDIQWLENFNNELETNLQNLDLDSLPKEVQKRAVEPTAIQEGYSTSFTSSTGMDMGR